MESPTELSIERVHPTCRPECMINPRERVLEKLNLVQEVRTALPKAVHVLIRETQLSSGSH